MTHFKVRALVYQKKKGISTDVTAVGKVAEDLKLHIKICSEGTLSPEKEQALQDIASKAFSDQIPPKRQHQFRRNIQVIKRQGGYEQRSIIGGRKEKA